MFESFKIDARFLFGAILRNRDNQCDDKSYATKPAVKTGAANEWDESEYGQRSVILRTMAHRINEKKAENKKKRSPPRGPNQCLWSNWLNWNPPALTFGLIALSVALFA